MFEAIPDHTAQLSNLIADTPWQRHEVVLFGRRHLAPRLSCWMGDADARYRYSGTTFAPEPWTQPVQMLRNRVSELCESAFNSVLLNLYRDGQDSMGAHSDDETELGRNPVIASLSLGATRDFVLKHRRTGQRIVLPLPAGSLLVMAGTTQHHWLHSLPKRSRVFTPRLNLTFRQIFS